MNWRIGLLAAAVVTAGVGLVLAFAPSVVGTLQLSENVPMIIGVLAIVAGLSRGRSFLRHEPDEFRPAVREDGRPLGIPGDPFDDLLGRVPATGVASDRRALKARQELEEIAVTTLVRRHGLSRAEASQRLADGSWTDDRLAAEFFVTHGGTGGSLRESVALPFGGTNPFDRRAQHASREIVRLSGGDQS